MTESIKIVGLIHELHRGPNSARTTVEPNLTDSTMIIVTASVFPAGR